MNDTYRILYLKDPFSPEHAELSIENNFLMRSIVSPEDLFPALFDFVPDILIHSTKSTVSPREVLDVLNLPEDKSPVVISIPGNNLNKISAMFPALLLASNNTREDNSSPIDIGEQSGIVQSYTGNKTVYDLNNKINKSREAQEDLYHNYKTIFYKSPIPYWIYNQETLSILEVNEAAINNYGYTREEFLNLSIIDLRPEDEKELLKSYLKKPVADGKMRYGQFIHLKKDRTTIKVEVYGYELNYLNKKCRLVACVDITAKEEAIALLEEKQSRLNAAQEIAKMGYWELNLSTQVFFLSDMVYTIWGREKTTNIPEWDLITGALYPEDINLFLDTHKNSIREGKEHSIEYRILQPGGELRWIQERGRVLTWRQNRPETVERIVRDITEEKNFLQKLTTSESRYKGIVKSQTNYLIRADLKGNYSYYNDKFLADFGWFYGEKEILGQPVLSSVMKYHHQDVLDIVERCCKSPGMVLQIEFDKPRKNGGVRSTLWDFVCLLNPNGQPWEIQCVGTDISRRVKTEKQLKDSKLRYKLITRATSDAIWDWDINSGKLYWSNSLKTMFGYDPKNFTSIEIWDGTIHKEDSERIKNDLKIALEGTGKKWSCEYRLRKANGDYAYVLEKGTFIRDKTKKAYRMVGAVQDITEKKKLQDLLENANTLSRVGSFELDLRNENLYWSSITKEIHEVGEDYVPDLEKAFNFYKEGENRSTMQKVLKKAVEKNTPYDLELQITTASGKDLWVRMIGQPEIEEGVCVKITGSFQDVDKIKRAESEVLKAAIEKQTLLESIRDAFFAVDRNWMVPYWNNQAASLVNCPKSEVLKKNLWEVFPEAIDSPFQRNYEATMLDKQKRHFEAYFDRTSSWFEVTVYPTAEGLSIFFKDVTQRKLAEGRLKELNRSLRAHTRELVTANKGLEQFSYIVSHNLRSPVANITGLSHLLQNDDYPQEVREQLFKQVFDNVDRLDEVIKDLNNILQVRVDIKTTKEKIDLYDLVAGIRSSIQHVIQQAEAVITCDFGDSASLMTVKSYLYSIFYNLILNSIKFRRPGIPPVIEISAKSRGEFIILNFKDNGLGIDLSAREDQIFNLYKRFHHHVEGKGMGLFMVRTQVEMLGGKISLQSKINSGTTFTIVFKETSKQIQFENE